MLTWKRSSGLAGTGLALALWLSGVLAGAQTTVDPQLPDYRPVEGVAGSIKSVGSDTMNNLMTLWGEGFKSVYPNVTIEIEGKGSGTAPPALIAGASNFGPMSRQLKSEEADEFEKKFGYKPVQLPTSIDMLAIYVNKDNPIQGLSLAQVDAIFGKGRKLGYPTDIVTWGEAGLTGDWADKAISLYGRNSASGTYGFLKEHVLGDGDYKDSVKEQPGSSSVVQGVGSDLYAIGYSGIGYRTADVNVVPLAPGSTTDYVVAEPQNAYSGKYPLSRFLYLTVNYKPGSQLEPLRAEFLKFVFSKNGQQVVIKDGYLPLNAAMAEKSLEMVGLSQK